MKVISIFLIKLFSRGHSLKVLEINHKMNTICKNSVLADLQVSVVLNDHRSLHGPWPLPRHMLPVRGKMHMSSAISKLYALTSSRWQMKWVINFHSHQWSKFFFNSCHELPKACVRSFHRPSGQTGQEEKCWLWGHRFKGEHLSKGGKLGPLQWAACDLSPQLCDLKSHASAGKHTCWKACWECSRVLSTHTGRFKVASAK